MPKKQPFPPEPETEPDAEAPRTPRQSGPAPRNRRERSQAPTVPPPRDRKLGKPADPRPSNAQSRKAPKGDAAGATVDEVVADLSKDPRRERDD